jgi:hypothetical protein
MNSSEKIRALAQEGLGAFEIARRLNIRYQHAYKVLKDAKSLKTKIPRMRRESAPTYTKPNLTTAELLRGGFQFSGRWVLTDADVLSSDRALPKAIGVYAFTKDGVALYVGVATMGLAKRLYFYGKPGVSQRTSQRIHTEIRAALKTTAYIDIYTATPPDSEWNGLPVHGSARLELGLIKKYALPWNVRSAGQ